MSTEVATITDELPPEVAKKLEGYARAIDKARTKGNLLIFEVGKQLKLANAELANNKNGRFEKWVEDRCGFSDQTARNYMSAIDTFEEKYWQSLCQYCTGEAIYFLSRDTTPPDAVTDALAAAEAGERVTLKKAKELAETYTVDAEAEQSPWDLFASLEKVCGFVDRVYQDWPGEELPSLSSKLRSLADQIDSGRWMREGDESAD